MVTIKLDKVGKKFNKKWIFRSVSHSLTNEHHYSVVGHNGSGKSTLLQIISSFMLPSEGAVEYNIDDIEISNDKIYHHLSFAAPYMELIEEFKLIEVLDFHQKIKGFKKPLLPQDIISLMGFEAQKNKAVKNFSSGMKQRLKLALAFYSDTSILLLDEPTSNLDQQGINWYQTQLSEHSKDRLVIICSNHKKEDLFSCSKQLNIENFS